MSREAEGLALQKLDKPITETATIRLKYKIGQKVGVTRNGALVVASKSTNTDSFNIVGKRYYRFRVLENSQ